MDGAFQGTDEWHTDRLGKVTASMIANVMMAKTTAGYQNYASQLICERLTGQPTETFKSAAMEHGTETEPQARAAYTMATGNLVQEVGFCPHATMPMSGASPDGIVGELGLVEIKCPQATGHIKNLTGGKIARNYLMQMQWQMECTGREWCDFVSFNPNLPDELQITHQRIGRDSELQAQITDAVRKFLREVDAKETELRELMATK